MTFMLPAVAAHSRSITGVAPELLASLEGRSAWGEARSVVMCVIDGLGALQLRANAGHARHLTAMFRKKDVAHSVFPSTTAAALTALLTGAMPGQHGLVGYSALDPHGGTIINQLSGWEKARIDSTTWQHQDTIFEQATAAGYSAFVVGPREYVGSGFSLAVLRGAEYVPVDTLSERFARAVSLANDNSGSVVYCYIPEIDKAGHKFGTDSGQWLAALEDVDASMAVKIPNDVGVVITADHGMINVPRTRHVLLDAQDERLKGVSQLGGEPRMLHVYLDEGESADDAAARWRDASGQTADILTRTEAVAANLYGPVAETVLPRIGDLLVIARGLWAFYDDRLDDKRSQNMIGQHGALSPEETTVPLLRAGAFTPEGR